MATTTTTASTRPTTTSTASPSTSTLTLTVEFTGGLEILFDNVPKHRVTLPALVPNSATKDKSSASASATTAISSTGSEGETETEPATIGYLIQWLREKLLKDPREELFVVEGTVRPGILVLINDADWELEGEEQYELKDGDNVLFVSTLHGG